MAEIDPKLKVSYERYIRRHRKYEFIDCAIFTQLNSYVYIDNEFDLFTNTPHKNFATDLVYMAKDRKAILLIEETEDPSLKLEQLINYSKLSAESAKTITKTDAVPAVDVMLVIPEAKRSDALKIYDDFEKEVGNLSEKRRGISIWYYDQYFKALRLCGGSLSPVFPKEKKILPSKSYGTFKILKTAPPVFLLLFIIMKALESEYGISQKGIEINKEKLEKWLGPYGIIKEEKWAAALKIGQDLRIISNFSSQQVTGTLNYSKAHPSSIGRLRAILADPFNIKVEDVEVDESGQRSLFEFDTAPEDKPINSEED
jgi:hypothetical protein